MSYSNPRYVNEEGFIAATTDVVNNIESVIEPNHPDYNNLVAGIHGAVEAYVPPVVGPTNYQTATKLSVMRYLKSTGQWATIKAALVADEDMYDEWLVSSELLISDPTVQAMKALMGWTDEQLQDLFNTVNE